jgi:diguanylate cyclase (GGDEF)-like protein
MPDSPFRRRTDREPGDAAPLRALVVDDNAVYREFIGGLISRFGFAVTGCADGAEALGALHRNAPFHLLVVDCEMPGVSGLGLISAVRNQEKYTDVYAVMLTAREDVETKVAALRLGFDDYLTKSAGEQEIAAKMNAARRLVLRQKRLHDSVRELYGLATRDELTGLFNRRFFFAEAERLLGEGTAANLVLFDLDEFKLVNDCLGHMAGDRILRDIGALFLRGTRHEDLIARYGGDEFVMLVTALDPQQVEDLAARMSADIQSVQWTFGTETHRVGVTTGMACSTLLKRPTVAQLLSAGDRDLYKNKWLKKNPDLDPSLYRYDSGREAQVVELDVPEARQTLRDGSKDV